MNRRDYFLQCLNTLLVVRATTKRLNAIGMVNPLTLSEVTGVLRVAWRLPEEAIPADPAQAAHDFYEYECSSQGKKPDWLDAWEESQAHG